MTKTTDTPAKIVVADLESLYQEIELESNRVQFFIKIAHYGQYIQENKFTTEILGSLYQEAHDDAKVYLNAWKKFVKVWKKYAKDLIEKAKEAGIKDDPNSPLSNEIAAITSKFEQKETSIWETDLSYYYRPYQTLIWKFKEIGKADLLVPEHVEAEEGMIVIYPSYVEASDEWDKFKYSREAKAWWAHYQITRLAVGVLGKKEERQYFKRDNIIDAFYKFEFDEVARGNVNRSPIVLHEDKYNVWIKRLHNYLIPRLQNVAEISQKADVVDYTDTATRRGVGKKWDVLQVVWSVYEASSRADSIMVPTKRLSLKDSIIEEIDSITDGFKREGIFSSWKRYERHYAIEGIDHDKLPEYYEDTKNLYSKFATEYQVNVEQTNYVTRNNSAKELTKRQLRNELSNVIKTAKFGKKEKSFLKFLAKDFGPKTIMQIGEEVGSKACKQLKARINTRIKNTGFYIETIRAEKWGGQAHYQLKYGTQSVKQ